MTTHVDSTPEPTTSATFPHPSWCVNDPREKEADEAHRGHLFSADVIDADNTSVAFQVFQYFDELPGLPTTLEPARVRLTVSPRHGDGLHGNVSAVFSLAEFRRLLVTVRRVENALASAHGQSATEASSTD